METENNEVKKTKSGELMRKQGEGEVVGGSSTTQRRLRPPCPFFQGETRWAGTAWNDLRLGKERKLPSQQGGGSRGMKRHAGASLTKSSHHRRGGDTERNKKRIQLLFYIKKTPGTRDQSNQSLHRITVTALSLLYTCLCPTFIQLFVALHLHIWLLFTPV